MQSISAKDTKYLASLPQKCAKCGKDGVQWHHVFTSAGRQIKEWFNIAFACERCHHEATPHNTKYRQETREYFEWYILKQHFEKLVFNYPKNNWAQLWNYLSKKYVYQSTNQSPKR